MPVQYDYQPGYQAGSNGAATRAIAIVPNDGAKLPWVATRIWVGIGGDITLIPRDGLVPVTFPSVPGGKFFEMTARQVLATGTTASGLVAAV